MKIARLVLVCAVAWPAAAGDWPGFLGPGRDGHSDETGLSLDWPEGGPPTVWSIELGEGYAMASIAGGRLFLFDRVDGHERLRALGADDGGLLWEKRYPVDYEDAFGFSNGPRASPLVDGERVVTYGVTGRLQSRSVADGALIFDIDTIDRYGVVPNFFGVGSNPTIHGELLIAMVGGSPDETPGLESGEVIPDGSAIVAFDRKSGEERYRVGDELASYSSPIVVDGRGFALLRGGLIAFDPVSGKQRGYAPWRAKKLYSVNAATPVVVGDRIFITEGYRIGGHLLRAGDSRLTTLWKDAPRERSIASHWGTPVHHEGVLYGSHGESRGSAELRAVRLDDGEVLWKVPGLSRTTAIVVDGHLIVLSEEGRLLVAPASAEGFEPISDLSPEGLDYPAWNAPALANGRLYVRGKDRLFCYDLRRAGKAAPSP